MGYNLAFVRDICKIFASTWGFSRMGHAANEILPQPSLVAMATKFGTKWAITWHMYDISPRSTYC